MEGLISSTPTFRNFNMSENKDEIRFRVWCGYYISGNRYLAIAINVKNPKDAHHFSIDPDVNNDAFIRACGWAFQP